MTSRAELEVPVSSSRTSSASRPSASVVKPTRSANRTETSRRSATGRAGRARAGGSATARRRRAAALGGPVAQSSREPHSPQKPRGRALTSPHDGQIAASASRIRRRTCGRLRWRCRTPDNSPPERSVRRRVGSPRPEVARAPANASSRASSGTPRPTPRTRPAAAPGPPRRRTRRRARGGRSPTARAGSARSSRPPGRYSSDSVMSETVVSSVLSVTETPARCEPGQRVLGHATARSRPASSRSGTGRASRPAR